MSPRLIETGPRAGQQALVKAEILLTRACFLRCSGCGFHRSGEEASLEDWCRTIDALSVLGCGFLPIFGGDPACVPEKTEGFIRYASARGIPLTVIVSGVGLTTFMLNAWHDAGLRSLTMSLDWLPDQPYASALGASRLIKSKAALKFLPYFARAYPNSDVEAMMTLTRVNYHLLPEVIRRMSAMGIWVNWDFLNVATKGMDCVAAASDVAELVFRGSDLPALQDVLAEARSLKQQGLLVQASEVVFDCADQLVRQNWQCRSGQGGFLGMVSIDADCCVRQCLGFCPPEMRPNTGRPIYGWELADRWEEFVANCQRYVQQYDCRCSWSTHLDSQLIYEGSEALTMAHYLHTQVSDH